MPRRVKLPTLEMGDIQLLLVDGWDAAGWEVLRGTVFGGQLSVVDRDVVNHALHRLSRPLVDSLGIPPEGALRKVPQQCWHSVKRKDRPYRCPLYDRRQCFVTAPDMPWCFEPEVSDEVVRTKAAEAVGLWREGIYVVVVED